MRIIIIILPFLILSFLSGYAQDEMIYLGKKGNIIWDKNISQANLASPFNYYYPIYYKTNMINKFQKIGIFGKHIAPSLSTSIPEITKEFKKYKRDKKLSYVLLGGAITSLSMWTYTSASYIDKTGDYGVRAFFKPQHVPYLLGYFGCFYGSIQLNLAGDKHLRNAVLYHNKSLKEKGKD